VAEFVVCSVARVFLTCIVRVLISSIVLWHCESISLSLWHCHVVQCCVAVRCKTIYNSIMKSWLFSFYSINIFPDNCIGIVKTNWYLTVLFCFNPNINSFRFGWLEVYQSKTNSVFNNEIMIFHSIQNYVVFIFQKPEPSCFATLLSCWIQTWNHFGFGLIKAHYNKC